MESVGEYLRRCREERAMTVDDIARDTRIPRASLELLESDRFVELPAEVFVRGFLRAYARALGIPVSEILASYKLGRRAPSVSHLPIESSARKVSAGRSWALAIGLVALLILFTVVLSLVLRPPASSAPGLV
jgi:cytoskeletal protein RodZ